MFWKGWIPYKTLFQAVACVMVANTSADQAVATAPSGPTGTYSLYPPTRVEYFNQTVDHFTYDSSATFRQKYLVYDNFSKSNETDGASSTPKKQTVFFFFGGEGGVEDFYNNSGALFEYAPEFGGALIVFLEHRYYGTSIPRADLVRRSCLVQNALVFSGRDVVFVDAVRRRSVADSLGDLRTICLWYFLAGAGWGVRALVWTCSWCVRPITRHAKATRWTT